MALFDEKNTHYVINYQLPQKLKLIENSEFNHLTSILKLLIGCGILIF